jgi:hypothetical protein
MCKQTPLETPAGIIWVRLGPSSRHTLLTVRLWAQKFSILLEFSRSNSWFFFLLISSAHQIFLFAACWKGIAGARIFLVRNWRDKCYLQTQPCNANPHLFIAPENVHADASGYICRPHMTQARGQLAPLTTYCTPVSSNIFYFSRNFPFQCGKLFPWVWLENSKILDSFF